MDTFENYLHDTINFEEDVDPKTFEEFIEMEEEYVDHSYLFETDILFDSKIDLVNWTRKIAKTIWYISKRRFDRRPYVTLGCEREEGRKKKARLEDDDEDEEEEAPVKRRDERHNHKTWIYPYAHAQAARLTDDQLKLTEEFTEIYEYVLQQFKNLHFEFLEPVVIVTDKESAAQNILHLIIPLNLEDWKNVEGDGNIGFRMISYFLYGDENQWPKILHDFAYWIGFAPRHCWMDNCMILPSYSASDRVRDMIVSDI
ncbi:hypothetical protein M9H77_11665 [Catharanthus roseus]|uniref:Uncharacterized protein n=1 Tax=Catharanthus roseus TaxID=4058 RepID=A0ACC0BF89_CATRO|nr:hypothetical protein M9H77_11665 [Catharanthus roseus]